MNAPSYVERTSWAIRLRVSGVALSSLSFTADS